LVVLGERPGDEALKSKSSPPEFYYPNKKQGHALSWSLGHLLESNETKF